MARAYLVGFAALLISQGGCAFFDSGDDDDDDFMIGDDSGVVTRGGGVGDSCDPRNTCRASLACTMGTCQPSGMGTMGATCELTGDCGENLYCGATRTCEAAGQAAAGGDCESTAGCTKGLVCTLAGFGGRCLEAGMGDIGDACAGADDCLAGLSCIMASAAAAQCASPPRAMPGVPVPPFPLPYWAGVTCEAPSGDPRAYFEVPRAGSTADFFRLPFPNDIRRKDGHVDLEGHPHPGTALSIDIIDRYLRASETDLSGFSNNPIVYFRFSEPYDWGTVGDAIRIVDITPGSPSYGQSTSLGWLTTSGPLSKYLCENWLAMRPGHGDPLRHGTTYAAIVAKTMVRAMGGAFDRDQDFEVMLGTTMPSDAALRPAWQAYAPLRAYLDDDSQMQDASDVLVAAVFTTQEPEALVPRVRQVIRARPAPTLSDVTVCTAGARSPCDDGEDRVCGAPNDRYIEVQGRIELPIFQQGTAPYEDPEDGGGFDIGADGTPRVVRTEQVCFALAVPRDVPPPAEGFPLLIVGHGTGGSYHGNFGGGELADTVADAMVDGSRIRAATLAIDMPAHGSRRGDSDRSPEVLFYNFVNPRAARDNVLQGTADLLSLMHFATSYDASASESPTGEALRFDDSKIVMFAHSQSATHASLMIGHEPDLAAVVLSGNGGNLILSLLNKTEPVNIARVLPFALLDFDEQGNLAASDFHPALGIFQAYFDSVDPLNFARGIQWETIAGQHVPHVFMTYGPGDSYSPELTMQAYASAADLPQVRPVLVGFGRPEVDAPLVGNMARTEGSGEGMRTTGLRQYMPPSGVDGHFVSTRSDDGREDVHRFILEALAGQVPHIGAP